MMFLYKSNSKKNVIIRKLYDSYGYKFIEDLSLGCCKNCIVKVEDSIGNFYVIKISENFERYLTEVNCYHKLIGKKNVVNFIENFEMLIDINNSALKVFVIVLPFYLCLGKSIADGVRYNLENILDGIIRITNGVKSCHESSILHLDLKLFNIFYDENDIYVGDFDGSCLLENMTYVSNYKTYSLLYASPEVFEEKNKVDIRSDIYSIGIIMYEWITGNVPFMDEIKEITYENVLEIIHRRKTNAFKVLNIPISLYEIIKKCCYADSSKRYSCCDELLSDLQKIKY